MARLLFCAIGMVFVFATIELFSCISGGVCYYPYMPTVSDILRADIADRFSRRNLSFVPNIARNMIRERITALRKHEGKKKK